MNNENVSEKSALAALLLNLLVWWIPGLPSFYVGRWGMGLAKLFTFNFVGVGWIIDLIMICTESFRDCENKCLRFKS